MGIDYNASGFVPKVTPVSARDAVQMQSPAYVKTVVKNAVARYLGSYFEENGSRRHYTKDFFPGVLNLIADKNFVEDSESAADNKVRFPIYKAYADIQGYMPCIVISDSGMVYKSPGLGWSQGNVRLLKKTAYRMVQVMRTVNITLLIVSGDQATTEAIADALAMIFGDIAGIASGMALEDTTGTAHWICRFPKVIEIGTPEAQPQGEDAKDMIWKSSTPLPIEYEDAFLVPVHEPDYAVHAVSPKGMPETSMSFPTQIRVGTQVLGTINNLDTSSSVSISDPAIATLRAGPFPGQYYVLARKTGHFSVRVLKGTAFSPVGSGVRGLVLAEAAIDSTY